MQPSTKLKVATLDNESFGKAEVVFFAESLLPARELPELLQATKQLTTITRKNLCMAEILEVDCLKLCNFNTTCVNRQAMGN